MTLQFIRGTADKDLEQPLIEASVEWLHADQANEVFYLVPNHIKFEQEINVLKRLKNNLNVKDSIASLRLQVFSFYRLAWYYLQHTQFYSSEILSEAGAAMVFRKILSEQENKLKIFRGEVNKSGFIQQLLELYQEMKDGNISIEELPSMLQNQGEKEAKEQDIQLKMQDIQLIFTKFDEAMQSYGIKSVELIDYLAAYLKNKELKNVLVIIHGYSHFSARELNLLQVLMGCCGQMKVSFVLDRKYSSALPQPMTLFFQTGTSYYQLYQVARQEKIAILTDIVAKTSVTSTKELLLLQECWLQSQEISYPMDSFIRQPSSNCLQLWKAETIKEEVDAIAKEIRRLVSEKKYRYKDIQIVTRELNSYDTLIEPLFSMNDIPVYVDHDMAMEHHPLVEFIQSLFSIQAYNYRYRDVLRFLRTELFFPINDAVTLENWQKLRDVWRKKVDLTENVILAYGYEGYQWIKNEKWHIVQFDFESGQADDTAIIEQEANDVRQLIQTTVPAFFKRLKDAKTGIEAAKLFYEFLIQTGVEKQLMMWRNQAIENGHLEAARNHEQTWQALMALLDDYVRIYGSSFFELHTFEEVFSSGLQNLRYNKVPTAIDQVQVGSIDLIRPAQAKVIFAIGLTDQVFPQKYENRTLLSDEERERINNQLSGNHFLSKDVKAMTANEPFIAYSVYSSATERLYLTYPAIKDTTKDVKMSPYVERIKNALTLPLLEKQAVKLNEEQETSLARIATYRTLISDLTSLKQQIAKEKKELPSFWQQLEQHLVTTELGKLAKHVFSSLTYQNIPETLKMDLAMKLYTKDIYTSVSRMESFYRCQYQYFSQFGLRLKERKVFGLSPAATGDFFHEALDQFFKRLFSQKKQLATLTDQEVMLVTEEVLQDVFGEAKFSILNSSKRMNYIRYQLGQTIKKVSWALKKQSERNGMTTIQTEILFGQIASEKGIKGLELPLTNGGKMSVRGKIDRIDQLSFKNELYLSVIDYKSSHKKFNITEAYYGLAMQMLTYLDVALMDAVNLVGRPAKAAGSLYLHVQNPTLPFEIREKTEQQLLKKFQFDGLLVNEPELLDQLDTSLEPKQSSLIYPIEESAKEIIKPGRRQENKFVTEKELSALLSHNRRKFVEAGNKITEGKISLNPAYQGKERIACRFCPFRSVCTFDVMLKENNYERIDTLSKEDIMDRILDETQEGGQFHE